MTSEVIQELNDNFHKIQKIISNQKFTVGDAQRFLDRYYNVIRKMEDLETSRDNWKRKFQELNTQKTRKESVSK